MNLIPYDEFELLTDKGKYAILKEYYTKFIVQKDFVNRLIEKHKLAQPQLDMIIFDMDTIDGKPATQEELCEIFNILNNDEE